MPLQFHKELAAVLTVVWTLVSLAGCTNNDQVDDVEPDIKTETQEVSSERVYITISEDAKYRDDFQQAIERGDRRFVGIMGYSLQVPGVRNYEKLFDKSNGVKIIEGTSDSYSDSASHAQQILFRDYARSYNTLLLRHLGHE